MNDLILQLQDPNTQWVLFGTVLLGIASGVVGSFALLRKQSLIGDAMAHAALPGVCIAFLLYGTKSLFWFTVGAAISGFISTWLIHLIVNKSRIKEDSAIGLVLSVFFGLGIVLLTYIQNESTGNKSGLDDFIFGQAASLVRSDVMLISSISGILLIATMLFFKEFKLITFDKGFAKGLGIPVKWFDNLLILMIVLAVVIGLQAVGVVLMAAMLITPAIAARYWTDSLSLMIIIAGGIGAISGGLGTLISTTTAGLPTGPLIIVAATSIFLFSLVFAPKRGLLQAFIKHMKLRKRTAIEQFLLSLYDLTEKSRFGADFILEDVLNRRKIAPTLRKYVVKEVTNKGYATIENNQIVLTETGLAVAYDLTLEQRLYETYLMHELEFQGAVNNKEFHVDLLTEQEQEHLFKLMKLHERVPLLAPHSPRLKEKKVYI
ncbi:metal ABC transporter permease [Bacillus sp. FJAT-47783]|uniref:metal ABC transporter permease n=1 Tax=Bacillus sp. FJAT-47783 TaxID=2922712 RepID=UPI001FAD87C3